MAQCKLTPHEFIQNAFSPMVAVMCSPLVDQACQKNNLSFTEMLQPFCKLNTEATFHEPSGSTVVVRNLRIVVSDVNSRPPQPTLARKFLNESVSLSSCERTTSLQIGNQTVDIPASIPWFEAWRETFLQVQFPSDHEFTKHYISCILVVSSSENNPVEMLRHMGQQLQQLQNVTPAKLPKWFCPGVLRYYILLHDVTDGDRHKAESAFSSMKSAYGESNCHFLQMNSRPPGAPEEQSNMPDPWSQFLVRQFDSKDYEHDSSPRTPADAGGVTVMPNKVTEDSCDGETLTTRPNVILMSSLEVAQEAGESIPVPVMHHPLSPDGAPASNNFPGMEKPVPVSNDISSATTLINTNVWAEHSSHAPQHSNIVHGACLSSDDLDAIRTLIQDYCTKALIPYVERQIQNLNEMVSNKKGVSRSLFSATKRWFGSNKPGSPGTGPPVNAIYSSDAPELQLRRLGDICFMFSLYSLAFQAYHSAKRDFSADQAWLHYAGALEMAALSTFMQGEVTRKSQEYMDESITTYLNSCKLPQFATRATLFSTECLKGRSFYGEAAKQFIRMTCEDSDLRSALLLEQAAYCFLKSSRPRMTRKYAFHVVLAGHRFSKAGQRKHSLRCYRQAFQVYEGKDWSLAEDHIHFTIGRQAANLKLIEESAKAFSRLLSPCSKQSPTQQAAFLREYLTAQQQLCVEESNKFHSSLPILPIPTIDHNNVCVLLGPMPPSSLTEDALTRIPASGITFDEPHSDISSWHRLEELLVTEAQGGTPMIFKPSLQLYSKYTNNSVSPVGVVDEPVNVSITLQNSLHIPLPLQNVHLLWRFRKNGQEKWMGNESNCAINDTIVTSQCLSSVILLPDSFQNIVLFLVPKCVGTLHIVGIGYGIKNPAPAPVEGAPPPSPITVFGKQNFDIQPRFVKNKDKSTQEIQDRRLEINVIEAAPCLQVTFCNLCSEMLCGEMQRVNVELCNVGNTSLKQLHLASSTPELFTLESASRTECRQVTSIPLPPRLSGLLTPQQIHSFTIWIRAPDISGIVNLDMLFYYENTVSGTNLRYRLVRHLWQLTVLNSIQLLTTVQRGRSRKCEDETQEFLNMTVTVKNTNQVQEPVITEISPLQISLVSRIWKLLNQVVTPEGVKLQPQESVHLLTKACRSSSQSEETNMFSDVVLDKLYEENVPFIKDSPYLDFYTRHKNCHSVGDPLPGSASIGGSHNDNVETAQRVDAVLVLRWKANVTDGSGKARIAIGQHHISLNKVGTTTYWPPDSSQTFQQLQHFSGPMKIFDPDASSLIPSDMYYAPLEVLQRLVNYTIHHPPKISNNFQQKRICLVPVQLVLQNCSDSHLVVKVNALGNNTSSSVTSKNQLYLPHSSTSFRWVGVSNCNFELSPHSTHTVKVCAAISFPGTFDLGTRIEVWCRTKGSPEADAVAQTWRVESSIVVNHVS